MGQLPLLHAWPQSVLVTQPDIQQVLSYGSLQVSELEQNDSRLEREGGEVGTGLLWNELVLETFL